LRLKRRKKEDENAEESEDEADEEEEEEEEPNAVTEAANSSEITDAGTTVALLPFVRSSVYFV